MPDFPRTPGRHELDVDPKTVVPPARAPFVELGLVSCFSFLRGASLPVDLVTTARALGYDAIGIADVNSMAGVVRHHTSARKLLMKPVIGCRIETVEGLVFLAYPVDRAAYGRLCRLISAGRMSTIDGNWQAKGVCHISLAMLADHSEGVQLILVPPRDLDEAFTVEVESNVIPFPPPGTAFDPSARRELSIRRMRFSALVPDIVRRLASLGHIAASYLYRGDDVARIEQLAGLARASGLKLLATNDVHYHLPGRRSLQDVMTAIRHKTTIEEAGHLLHPNAERHLKSPAEMQALFARWPHAITASRQIADACTFALTDLQYEYPEDDCPDGMTPQEWLERRVWEGANWRYPNGLLKKVKKTLEYELGLIGELNLARYFLTIKDIVDFARSREPPILCQGRGSAANSAVCFCLGITSVDPAENELLFDRFISTEEGSEPPDIDVDFEHERREEVIQYVYQRYGRDKAGLCATVIHYRPRMAIREVGKALGLTEDVISALARTVWGAHGQEIDPEHVRRETGLDLNDPSLKRAVTLADQMIGMPRHLSQHVGGFILTKGPLIETVPIGNGAMPERSFIEWDKDDIDDLRILKVDVLALGMLTCIRKAFDLIEKSDGLPLTLAAIPQRDEQVYDMLCKGDSIGVFQVESRAQMNMLPRLRPRTLYDLTVQVAIVRPGPIQGDMVHPYLKQRKADREGRLDLQLPAPADGPADELRDILARTYGVPIFQEQAMKIAIDAAKFSPAEAHQLRRAMATFRSRGEMHKHEEKMVGRMIARGYDPEFAQRCFNQIKGFGEYGFPESHAASFAHLVYVSSWLKYRYPAAFAAALLNSQPMGFYAPAQIVGDAREHGVTVLPVDVNRSEWDNTIEGSGKQGPLRLGFRQVDGFPEHAAAKIYSARQAGGMFQDVAELRDRARLVPAHIERLAAADCFRSLELPRRKALWDARALADAADLPLFASMHMREEGVERIKAGLPEMPLCEEVIADYQTQRLSLKAHPMSFLRAMYESRGFLCTGELRQRGHRSTVNIAGVVLIRQRPGSAKGVVFVTLEDETGVANLVIWPDMMERYRKVVMSARLIEVRGRVEYDENVIHVIVTHLTDGTHELSGLSDGSLQGQIARAGHVNTLSHRWQEGHPRDVRIIPRSRDFH